MHQLGKHSHSCQLSTPGRDVVRPLPLFDAGSFIEHDVFDPPAEGAGRPVPFPFDGDRDHGIEPQEAGKPICGNVVAVGVDEVELAAVTQPGHVLPGVHRLKEGVVRHRPIGQGESPGLGDSGAGLHGGDDLGRAQKPPLVLIGKARALGPNRGRASKQDDENDAADAAVEMLHSSSS